MKDELVTFINSRYYRQIQIDIIKVKLKKALYNIDPVKVKLLAYLVAIAVILIIITLKISNNN